MKKTEKLDKDGKKGIIAWYSLISLNLIMLLIAAGTILWLNAWIFWLISMLFQTIDFIVLASKNPEILNERGKFVKEGTKSYDEKFVVFYLIGVLAAMIIMGLDAARFKWYPLPNWGLLFGLIFILPGYVLGVWAMVSNPFFELTGRIQKEREHKVIDKGPYQFIRHPGYAGEIIMLMGTPFILQSLLGYIPIIGLIILFVIRTNLEDKTLKKELPGYKNYSKKTKYRLLPHIW